MKKAKQVIEMLNEKADDREMTNIIYDTLMKNIQHKQFDINKVTNQEVDAGNRTISFLYDGEDFEITINEKYYTNRD